MPSANRKRKPKPPSGVPRPSSSKAKRSGNEEDALQWISSNSESEDYGNLGDKERWEVDGIKDSHRGENDRMSYKIRWNKDDWSREDGTSEEWIPAPKKNCTEHQNLIKRYEAQEIVYFDNLPYIVGDEQEHAPFFSGPPSVSKNFWHQGGMGFTLTKHREFEGGDARKAGFTMFDIIDRNFCRGESSSSEEDDPPAPPPMPKPEPSPEIVLPPSSPSLGGSRNPSQIVDPGPSRLEELGNKWSQLAEKVGAAYITFTNETDTPNALPKIKKKFDYREMDIDWGPYAKTKDIENMFVACRCSDQCDRPNICGCQDPLFETIVDTPRALHKFAYNNKGLFRLSHQGVAIECNKSCRCSTDCPNRVAQQPRSVPMDIFTPSIQGWGVRPLRSIKAGQVLGTFTGEILTREKAEDLARYVSAREMSTGNKAQFDDHNRYLFDLDARHKKYTLNCWRYGNWTRFMNHSCDPNLKIYPTGLERLAVVAVRDILAREELTFDYSPGSVTNPPDPRYATQCGPNSNHLAPPPLYSEDAQQSGIESVLDDEPLILVTPPDGKNTFQSGFLGAEGDVSSLEGEVIVKGTPLGNWNKVTITFRSEEHVGPNKVELGFSKHTLWSQMQAPSTSTSPEASAMPAILPFSIRLAPDTPQCLHTPSSEISNCLIVTLESSTLPPISKTVEIHTRRYTTVMSPYLPVAPRRVNLDTPTPVAAEIPRTVFRSGEPIPIYWEIPPADANIMGRGLRLRNLRAELVRLIRLDNGDSEEDTESINSEDETGWAAGEPDMSMFASPPPTAGFEKGSSMQQMQQSQQSTSSSISPSGSVHSAIVTRSGAPARLHPTRTVRVRLVLHGLSHDPHADIQSQENTHEVCASISQTTLMHDVSFHVILRASFLVDGQEQTAKARIPVTIIPRVAPQVEVPDDLGHAYMKKHDKPPARTVRADEVDSGEGPSTGPPPAFEDGSITPAMGAEPSAPPPFIDGPSPYSPPPLEPSGSRLPTFHESESRANGSITPITPGSRLPTFFESESAAVAAASGSSRGQLPPPAPSGTFGEWVQTGDEESGMELIFQGEGSSYGFRPQDQFDGLTLGLGTSEQGLPTDPGLSHPHSSAVLSPDILADINSDPPPPLTPLGGDAVSNLAMRLQLLAAASSEANESAPPPPPPMDDPADPPPGINDHFRQTSGNPIGNATSITTNPQPVPVDGALPPYLNPGATPTATAGPPAYTDVPPRAGH